MRVLHFYRTYFPETHGGLEQVIRQICLNSRDYGVESRVLTLCDNPSNTMLSLEEADVIQVQRHAEIASCSLSINIWKEYERQVDWADIIHLHYPWPFGDLVHLIKGKGKVCVVTYHSDIIRQQFLKVLYRPLELAFLSSVNRIVATSPNYLQTSNQLQHYKDKVSVIPIGINSSAYPEITPDFLQSTESKYGREFFLFVGVFRYYKGLHILLEAMQGVEYQVIIAGAGPIQGKLKKHAEKLGLTNVHFLGYVPDAEKVALYKLCRAVVLPSYLRSEAFGVTLLEGAMYSKPLISAEIGSGTTYINIHNETGLVVEAGNASSLQGAMKKIHDDTTMAEKMGIAARKRYEEHFTGKLMGERYYKLYKEVLQPDLNSEIATQ